MINYTNNVWEPAWAQNQLLHMQTFSWQKPLTNYFGTLPENMVRMAKYLLNFCVDTKNQVMGSKEEKGLASTFFYGLVLFWVTIEKPSYNPAIVFRSNWSGRSFCPRLSLVRIGRGPRNTRRHKTGDFHSLLSCQQVETSRARL